MNIVVTAITGKAPKKKLKPGDIGKPTVYREDRGESVTKIVKNEGRKISTVTAGFHYNQMYCSKRQVR